jgi:molybdate transport system ATP-binding protein
MLEVALRHRFPGFSLDVAFTAPAEGVTALFGPSGCGKSTILAAVAGLLRPEQGRVALGGEALLDTATRHALPPERRRCGVVFQDSRLFPHLTVAANLRYGARRAPAAAPGTAFDEVVALLGIAPLLERRPARLSGGEKQRVALGRALLARPRLLLMDEPLAALDAARRAEVLPFLAGLREAVGVPVLYVTHALEEVDALADRLVLLEAGRVRAAGSVEELALRTDLPLAGRRDAGAVLACTVAGHEPARGLTRLAFAGGELVVPLRDEAPGSRARIRIRARDVAVATQRPQGISTQNLLAAEVLGLRDAPTPHEVFVELALGEARLLARITRDSARQLALAPGSAVFAVIKAASFDRQGSPPGDLRV